MKEKLESPKLEITASYDMIPWTPVIHSELDMESPYHGGTPIPQLKHLELHQRDFVHVNVKNNPKFVGKNSEAKKVFAKLSFHDFYSGREILSGKFGRWAESLQPPQVVDTEVLKYIDIPAGDEKKLDIATKYISHEEWFAFNTASYTADHFEEETNKIGKYNFKVKIHINYSGGETIRHFAVYTKGADGRPKIFEIPAF